MNTKVYKITMSKGDPIPLDQDELPNIIKSIQSGQPCVVKQGIFNPSYYVSIIEDKERKLLDSELKPLKNIFENLKLLK